MEKDCSPLLAHALAIAKKDDRVRAVVLNGSRVNPNVVPDDFQDIDVAMYVTDFPTYNVAYDRFTRYGEVLIMQTKAEQSFDPDEFNGDIALIQFVSGERLDVSFWPVETFKASVESDSLSAVLIDKDARITHRVVPSEASYHVTPPTEKLFQSCVKQFAFVSLYVAKGVARKHWEYAIEHVRIMRRCLTAMIDWSLTKDGSFSTGKNHAKYEKLLDAKTYAAYVDTFPRATKASIEHAFQTMVNLFETYARSVAEHHGFTHDSEDLTRITHIALGWLCAGNN